MNSIMFLLGAGASHEAGIYGIDKMTEVFLDDLMHLVQDYYFNVEEEKRKDYEASMAEEVTKLLARDIFNKRNKFDIELLLEALVNLDKKDHILYSILDYPDQYEIYDNQYVHLRNILIKFMRNQCENISTTNYLYSLRAFKPPENPLDIFTLNYDGTIEKMCKEKDIIFTDGFKEEWDIDNFEENNLEICLYKLHGSLYWFKTETGKYIKLPIKKIEVDSLIYFMDEKISETLIWPMVTKDYSTGPFPWLMETFRKKLKSCELCYVLGYSFRDDYIKKMILAEMQNNSKLWLFILDHNSEEIKNKLCLNNNQLKSRIITMNYDIEKALSYRILKNKHDWILRAREQEENAMKIVISYNRLSVDTWIQVFQRYRDIPHYDRIQYIVKYLIRDFQGEDYEVPALQWIVFDLALYFGLENIKKNYDETLYWFKIFEECSNTLDWVMSRGLADEYQLITVSKIPYWAKEKDPEAYASHFQDFTKMFSSIVNCMKIIGLDKTIQSLLGKFSTSLHLYSCLRGDIDVRAEKIIEMRKKRLVWSRLSNQLITIIKEKYKENKTLDR